MEIGAPLKSNARREPRMKLPPDKKILRIIHALRAPSLLLIAISQIALSLLIIRPVLQTSGFKPQFQLSSLLMLIGMTILLAGAGNLINDLLDEGIDNINNPDLMPVREAARIPWLMTVYAGMNLSAIGLGFFLSIREGIWWPAFIPLIVCAVLFWYPRLLKRVFLLGNGVAALLVALVPLIVLACEMGALSFTNDWQTIERNASCRHVVHWTLWYALFAFLVTLCREIIMDITDIPGDRAFGRKTIPVVIGTSGAKIFVLVLLSITLLLMFAVREQFDGSAGKQFVGIILGVSMIVLMIRLWTAMSAGDYIQSSHISGAVMIFGVGLLFL